MQDDQDLLWWMVYYHFKTPILLFTITWLTAPSDQSLRFKTLTAVWWRSTALECYAMHKTTIFIHSQTQSSSPTQHTRIFFSGYYHWDAQHCTWSHRAPLYWQRFTEPQSVTYQTTQTFINTALGTSDLVCLKHLAVLIYIWFNEMKHSNVQYFLPGKAQIFIILYSTHLLEKFFFIQKIIQSRTHTFCTKEPSYWSCYQKSLIFVWTFAWTSF
jgi:hypothetical protein